MKLKATMLVIAAVATACGKKDDEEKTKLPQMNYLNPEEIKDGSWFATSMWEYQLPVKIDIGVEPSHWLDDNEDVSLTLTSNDTKFEAIVDPETGKKAIFVAVGRKDNCQTYREDALEKEIAGKVARQGFWFAKADANGRLQKFTANFKQFGTCFNLSIVPQSETFRPVLSSDADILKYFLKISETISFNRFTFIRSGYLRHDPYKFSMFWSLLTKGTQEGKKTENGIEYTASSAPFWMLDGTRNEVMSESFVGDCQLDFFKNALMDPEKTLFKVTIDCRIINDTKQYTMGCAA